MATKEKVLSLSDFFMLKPLKYTFTKREEIKYYFENKLTEHQIETQSFTFGHGKNLGDVGTIHQKWGLSVWFLVEFNLSCFFINSKPVIRIIGFGIAGI